MLNRIVKTLSWTVAGLVLVSIFGFLAYDATSYQPRVGKINALIAVGAPHERSPPLALRKLLRFDVAFPSSRVAVTLIHELKVPYETLGWHPTNALWTALTAIHLTEDQRYAILASTTQVVPGTRGFTEGAQWWFSLPLEALDERQLATLVVLARWPSRYSAPENSGKLAELTDKLLANAAESTRR